MSQRWLAENITPPSAASRSKMEIHLYSDIARANNWHRGPTYVPPAQQTTCACGTCHVFQKANIIVRRCMAIMQWFTNRSNTHKPVSWRCVFFKIPQFYYFCTDSDNKGQWDQEAMDWKQTKQPSISWKWVTGNTIRPLVFGIIILITIPCNKIRVHCTCSAVKLDTVIFVQIPRSTRFSRRE